MRAHSLESHPNRRTFLATASAAMAGLAVGAARPASAQARAAYPEFSWARVQCFGDTDAGPSQSEVDFLAQHFPIVTLEGLPKTGLQATATDAELAATAAALKAANPNIKILRYWSMQALHPEYADSQTFNQSWIKSRNGAGQVLFNLSDPNFKTWWSTAGANIASMPNIDGLFCDTLNNIGPNPDKQAMLVGVRQQMSARGKAQPLLLGNGFPKDPGDPASFLNELDGIFYEHFDSYESTAVDKIRADMLALQKVAKAGKIICVKTWPGFTLSEPIVHTAPYSQLVDMARKNITFPLACFLAIAEQYSYLQYSWGYFSIGGSIILEADKKTVDPTWYPELTRPLGPPSGDATVNGNVFTRSFAHANVTVDISAHTAHIDWH